MIVGVPSEIKTDEYRVAMIPVGVEELTRLGHKVLIEKGAGQGSGIDDEEYRRNGAEIIDSAADIWQAADLIVKVKEPLPDEWPHMRSGQIIFTYFHFAADEELTRIVMNAGVDVMVHAHPRGAVSARIPCPPALGTSTFAGASVYVHEKSIMYSPEIGVAPMPVGNSPASTITRSGRRGQFCASRST